MCSSHTWMTTRGGRRARVYTLALLAESCWEPWGWWLWERQVVDCFLWAPEEGAVSTVGVCSSGPEQESCSWSWIGVHSFHTLQLVVRYSNTAFCSDHVADWVFQHLPYAGVGLVFSETIRVADRREVVISSRETWGLGRGPGLCLGSSLYKWLEKPESFIWVW